MEPTAGPALGSILPGVLRGIMIPECVGHIINGQVWECDYNGQYGRCGCLFYDTGLQR